jgi:arylsulfatase A-like enzyme/dienelactone hydrolase
MTENLSCQPAASISRTLVTFAVALLLSLTAAAAADKPNVVIIMPDDLSYDDFTFANPQGPRTPNIDSLARQSIRLTDFHVAPTCSPTRAALLTGRNNDAAGVWHTVMGRYFLRPNEVTLADVFKANGYRTALIGKWHLGDAYPFRPKDRGFEHVVMLKGGGIDQQPNPWGNRDNSPFTLFENDQPVTFTATNDPAAYTTDFLTTAATKFVAGCQQRGENFFLYLPYNVAHIPHSLPPDARPGADAHTATVENMDKNIGRLLASLDSAGLASNTVVLFLTDNGMANRRFRGDKATEYEAGHRVPCFIRWPAGGIVGDKSEAREVAQLTAATDVLPTLMDLLSLKDVASRPAEVPLHGRSLKSLLDANPANDDAALRGRIVVVDNQRMDDLVKFRQACVMQDEFDAAGKIAHKWRLNRPAANKPWELYDVQADAQQATNLLAQSPSEPDNKLAQTLETAYENWWPEISAHAAEYSRSILGSSAEPDACLYAHDWHMDKGLPPWNHTAIAEAGKGNGFHSVTFACDGTYTFDLRRWPRDIAAETTVTSQLKSPIRSVKNNVPILGEALPIHSARIRIWNGDKTFADEKADVAPDSDGPIFKLQLPAGPAFVQTWLYDANGKELGGAYYIYVERGAAEQSDRSDFSAQREQVLALAHLTNAPAMADAAGFAAEAGRRAIFFDALPANGKPTKVFAWLGLPEKRAGKVPGVVLVHGGGGSAFKEWVKRWNDKGFAAISIAVEGQTDEVDEPLKAKDNPNGWKSHAWPGPKRDGIYGDSAKPLAEQWMYHTVADAILANSLLRSLPEVDASRVGIMGVSWGGVITSTTMGIDERFAFAIPVYGCGHLEDAKNQYGRALGDNAIYKQVWNPMLRLQNAKMPSLWLSWPEDKHFPMDCQAASYRAATGPHAVTLIPGLKHGHGPAWTAPDSYAFAESVVQNGKPWCRQETVGLKDGEAHASFVSTKVLDRASLVSTTDKGFTGNSTWKESPATLDKGSDGRWQIKAPLPDGTTAWFLNVHSGKLTVSSEYQECN